jgi:hypothetical protein
MLKPEPGMNLLKRFKEPYPAEFTWGCALKYGVLTGIFVWLFFLLFEPFGLSGSPAAVKRILFPGYGLICVLSLLISDAMIPRLLPGLFREKNWKLWKNILWAMWATFIIGIGAFYLTRIVFIKCGFSVKHLSLIYILQATFFIGVFPITFITLAKLNSLLSKSQAIANETNPQIDAHRLKAEASPGQKKIVEMIAENEKDRFQTPLADLLYIAAEENYVEVFYQGEKVKKSLIRSSLSRIQEQLQPFYPRLFRCHRTYLVNMDKILKVSGNAQGLRLTIEGVDHLVPVARRYVDEFRKITREFG